MPSRASPDFATLRAPRCRDREYRCTPPFPACASSETPRCLPARILVLPIAPASGSVDLRRSRSRVLHAWPARSCSSRRCSRYPTPSSPRAGQADARRVSATCIEENHPESGGEPSGFRPAGGDCETMDPTTRSLPSSRRGWRQPALPVTIWSLNLAHGWSSQELERVDLELGRAVRSGVLRKHPRSSSRPRCQPFFVGHFPQPAEYILRGLRNEDLSAWLEERFEALPAVTHNRSPASGGLEQTHAGRETGRYHVGTGEVESKALRRVKTVVAHRWQVLDSMHIAGPANIGGILWAGYGKAPLVPACGRCDEQLRESRLPVIAVGPHVGKVPPLWHHFRIVEIRIDRAIEWPGQRSTVLTLQPIERWTACK